MKSLAACHFPFVPAPVNDVQTSDDVLNEVVALRQFLFRRAVLLTQDASAAEDLVQNTLERALAARVSFQPGTNIKAWLSVILRRRFIDDRRHARVRQRIAREVEVEVEREMELEQAQHADGPDPRDVVGIDDVVACLSGLSARDREVFELFHLHRFSYRQIAARLGVPNATVGTRIYRSKRRVRALLASTVATKSATLAGCAGSR
jgi:RNA polymerase sigma-70 factor (ECF subfamily)